VGNKVKMGSLLGYLVKKVFANGVYKNRINICLDWQFMPVTLSKNTSKLANKSKRLALSYYTLPFDR
jgi:hypothetical protein